MEIKQMPVWQWAPLLIAGFILALLMYGMAGVVDLAPRGGLFCLWCGLLSAGMLLAYALVVKWWEGAPAKDLPMKRCAPDTALGLALGLGYFCVVTGVMAIAGLYHVNGTGAGPTDLLYAFCYFAVVAVGEEILFRGVLFRWIDEKWGFPVALGVSALLCGLMHWSNPGGTLWSSVAIAVEAGLLLGAAYKWSGTLWLPIGIHWAWNFAQGNIFGFAVSGNNAGKSLLNACVEGPDWLSGGAFGAEASVVAVVAGGALAAWFIYRVHRKN